jgi:hypothetical protein
MVTCATLAEHQGEKEGVCRETGCQVASVCTRWREGRKEPGKADTDCGWEGKAAFYSPIDLCEAQVQSRELKMFMSFCPC